MSSFDGPFHLDNSTSPFNDSRTPPETATRSPLWKSESSCCMQPQDGHGVGGKRADQLVARRMLPRACTPAVFSAEEGREPGAPLHIPARVNASRLAENVAETMPILLHAYAGARKCKLQRSRLESHQEARWTLALVLAAYASRWIPSTSTSRAITTTRPYYLETPFFANGTRIPNGSYRFLLRALRVTGNPQRQEDYESWLSPVVGLFAA